MSLSPFGSLLCSYAWWFAKPAGSRQPGALLMQPLSAHCMQRLLRFKMGTFIAHCDGVYVMEPLVTNACASYATYMLIMMRDTWSKNVLPCSLCGITTLVC